jgi:hypothetical protein
VHIAKLNNTVVLDITLGKWLLNNKSDSHQNVVQIEIVIHTICREPC